MDIESFRDYCLSFEGATEKTPFGKFAERYDSILVFYVLDHMFCFIDMNDFTWCDVRSTPEKVEELRLHHASIGAPLNQDRRYWMKLEFGGDLSDNQIRELVAESYNIVKAKYSPHHRK